MWIMLSDCFFSIVAKDCSREELMIRARRPGDIEKVFPSARGKVAAFTASDYHYRCAISKSEIKSALIGEIDRVVYSNFKNSVQDHDLHQAYMRVWSAMAAVQPQQPYAARARGTRFLFDDFHTLQVKPAQKSSGAAASKGRGKRTPK